MGKLVPGKEFGNRHLQVQFGSQASRQAIETQDITKQAMVLPRQQVPTLCIKTAESGSAVLQARIATLDTKTHASWLRSHLQVLQQPTEMRVRTLIENDAPGIDVQRSRIFLDGNRMGMSTCVLVLLKERQLMVSRQVISGGKTSNTTAYDCQVINFIEIRYGTLLLNYFLE